MSIHTNPSTPSISDSPRGQLGRNALLVTIGGSVVLAAAVAIATVSRTDRHESASSAVQPPAVVRSFATESPDVSRSSGRFTPHTVYIVGSEEQAAFVWGGINDSNSILNDLGFPPMLDEVVVAATPERAAAVMVGVNESNQVLFDLYRVDNRIVDLRG